MTEPASPGDRPAHETTLQRPRLPAAAASEASRDARRIGPLYLLTLLSTVDGSLVVLAASGGLSSAGSAAAIGLTVIAGAGSWLAAQRAFASRPLDRAGKRSLALLGLLTLAATVASAALGQALGDALTLHVLPKAAGIVMCLIGIEVAGLRVPRAGRVPMPVAAIALGALLEVLAQWSL